MGFFFFLCARTVDDIKVFNFVFALGISIFSIGILYVSFQNDNVSIIFTLAYPSSFTPGGLALLPGKKHALCIIKPLSDQVSSPKLHNSALVTT